MSIDITPAVPQGRQLIRAYGDGGFRVAEARHEGSVLVFLDETLAWPVAEAGGVTLEALAPVVARAGNVDLLVVGCGDRFVAPPNGLRAGLKAAGLALEWMDTGAACRTFNVLLAEERRAAAALVAV